MTIIIGILSFVVVFGLMVFAHEFGHFFVAKRAGVRVREFGFGFPTAPDKPPEERRLTLKFGQDENGDAQTVSLRLAWKIAQDKSGTVYSLNLIPFGGFVNLGENDPDDPESLAHFPKRVRLATLLAGPAMNLILGLVIFTLASLIGYPLPDLYGVGIVEVMEGSPAEAAGIQSNDIILRVGELSLEGFAADSEIGDVVNSVVGHVATKADQEIVVVVQRGLGDDAERIELQIRPRADENGDGKMGVSIQAVPVRMQRVNLPFFDALKYGLSKIYYTIVMTFSIPIQVLLGMLPASSARGVGPVGIAELTGDAVRQSIDLGWAFPILDLTGVLNVAIAITNLLPLPALDGGRIFFILLETIRGKPIPPEKEGMVHGIGLMLLLLILVVITVQDIINPVSIGFNWADYFG